MNRKTLTVWLAMLLVGIAIWSFSGSPIAGSLLILAVLLSVVSPSGALYATCAAIPLVFHPVAIGSLQLGLLELGTLVSLGGFAIRSLYERIEHNQPLTSSFVGSKRSWILPITLLTLGTASLAWMPFDSHLAEALRTWRWVIFEPLVLFGLARVSIAREGAGPLTMAIVLPATGVALAALWQFGAAGSAFSVDDVQRSTATYLHPNNLALYLERALMLALVPALFFETRLRWFFWCLAAVIVAGLAVTFSRGAVIGLGVGCALVLLAQPIRNGWKYLSAGIATVLALFAIVAGARLQGAESSGYFGIRRSLWESSVDMLRDFPLTGIGLDQFLWLHQTRYIDPRIWSERYTSHPHNLVLDSWLSLGLPGVALLALFVVAGAWMIWKARTGIISLSPWQLGALGCLGAGIGHGMVDNGYFLADLAVLTWLAMALLLSTEPARQVDRYA